MLVVFHTAKIRTTRNKPADGVIVQLQHSGTRTHQTIPQRGYRLCELLPSIRYGRVKTVIIKSTEEEEEQ